MSVRGSLAAAGRAFAVTFGRFRGPGGRPYRAPAQTPSVPAPLAGSVLSVTGLDTAPHLASPGDMVVPAATRTGTGLASGTACSSYFGQKVARRVPRAYGRHWPLAICGYVPQQLRHAYGVTSSGMTGRGQTVAIVDAYDSHTIRGDAQRYAELTGDPVLRPGQFRQYRTGRFTLAGARQCGAPAKWHGEQTLDVESLHGLATAARIRYVAARSCRQQDLMSALAFIVNRHLASIVSDSWGWGASDFLLQPVANSIFRLGIAEGIGFFFSAGDSGYYTKSGIQPEFPTSSPWVTSVGGTSLAIGRRGQYRWETSWGTVLDKLARTRKGRHWRYAPPGRFAGFQGGGGGGVSTVYPQPFYQRGTVPPGPGHDAAHGHPQPGADAGGARRVGGCQPVHRAGHRPEHPAAREIPVRRHLGRRDQPGLPDHGRDRGRRPAGRGRPAGIRGSRDLRPVPDAGLP